MFTVYYLIQCVHSRVKKRTDAQFTQSNTVQIGIVSLIIYLYIEDCMDFIKLILSS